jgi:hypothetical protein
MPIDPEKFKQIITNHFATVTNEEFLENLRECSPYLFTDSSEEQKGILNSNADILIEQINPISNVNSPRIPGQDKGKVIISPDFDAPFPADILDEFYKS